MLRAKGVCFSTSARAIVLPEGPVSINRKNAHKGTVDMNDYHPEPEQPSEQEIGIASGKRALEQIRKQMGVVTKILNDLEAQPTIHNALLKKHKEMGVWMLMIKEALQHYDDGELSARGFANEVDAAIKGWQAT